MCLSRSASFLAVAAFNFPRCPARQFGNIYLPRFVTNGDMVADKSAPGSLEPYVVTYSRRKDKKSKEPADSIPDPVPNAEAPTNDSYADMSADMERLRKDPGHIDTLTVKELKALMRHAAIPVKGSKQELLSALRSYLTTHHSSRQAECMMTKRKTKMSVCEEESISGASVTKQKKAKSKLQRSDRISLCHQSETRIDQEILPIGKEELEKKSSQIRKKVSLTIESVSTESVTTEPWTVLTHKKPQPGWIAYNPKVLRPPPPSENSKSMKFMSWNVNGLKALIKSKSLSALQRENFDVLCLQETKIQDKDVDMISDNLIDGYDNSYWTCSISKLGYSGTAIISRTKPLSVKYGLGILDHDSEGRLVTVEFDSFYLLSVYVPNSGDGLKRLTYRINEWDPSLSNYMKELEKSKPVVVTGDMNCAHEEIDIYDPTGNRRSAGFTIEERKSFEKNFLSRGFVDTFRRQHPSVVGYSYYGYRHGGRKTNKGWRLDYYLVSESIADRVHDSYILPDVTGSDHLPIGLILKL